MNNPAEIVKDVEVSLYLEKFLDFGLFTTR
jgi:hypothetical protein